MRNGRSVNKIIIFVLSNSVRMRAKMRNEIFVAQIICLGFFFPSFADPYDSCKDILRGGIRDSISSQGSFNHQLAKHQEFCSIAKEKALNEYNYDNFAREYVNKTNSSTDTYGGGLSVGWGPFSGSANYNQSNIGQNASEGEKLSYLAQNKRAILDYFNQNCGNESHSESLRTEAVLISKVANPNIVKAWRDCMLERSSGFLVELVPSTTDLSGDQLEYSAVVHWQSRENTKLVSITLTFRPDMMEVSASNITTQNSYAKVDICEDKKCKLKSGSNLSVNILHKNRSDNLNITFEAKNNKGMMKTHIVTLPKKIVSPKIDLEDVNSYWAEESYCDNLGCLQYMKNISSQEHKIGEDFVASAVQLKPGTCDKCGRDKNLRFSFRNCNYKSRYQQKNLFIVESPEGSADDNIKYLYPFAKGRDLYTRIRILTEKK